MCVIIFLILDIYLLFLADILSLISFFDFSYSLQIYFYFKFSLYISIIFNIFFSIFSSLFPLNFYNFFFSPFHTITIFLHLYKYSSQSSYLSFSFISLLSNCLSNSPFHSQYISFCFIFLHCSFKLFCFYFFSLYSLFLIVTFFTYFFSFSLF